MRDYHEDSPNYRSQGQQPQGRYNQYRGNGKLQGENGYKPVEHIQKRTRPNKHGTDT